MQVHSRCGNHSDQCECFPNNLKGLCLSESTTEREREAVALCYLCGCIVAHCGGVILQVAGRLTLLHRESVRSRRYKWRYGRPSLTSSYLSLTRGMNPRSWLNSEILLDWDLINHTSTHTYNLVIQTKCHLYLVDSSCVHALLCS